MMSVKLYLPSPLHAHITVLTQKLLQLVYFDYCPVLFLDILANFIWVCKDTLIQQKSSRPDLLWQCFQDKDYCQEFNRHRINYIHYSQEIHQIKLIKNAKCTLSSKLQNQMSQHIFMLCTEI